MYNFNDTNIDSVLQLLNGYLIALDHINQAYEKHGINYNEDMQMFWLQADKLILAEVKDMEQNVINKIPFDERLYQNCTL